METELRVVSQEGKDPVCSSYWLLGKGLKKCTNDRKAPRAMRKFIAFTVNQVSLDKPA